VLLAAKAGKYGGALRGHWLFCHVVLLLEPGSEPLIPPQLRAHENKLVPWCRWCAAPSRG
jgi:hypothetical protein